MDHNYISDKLLEWERDTDPLAPLNDFQEESIKELFTLTQDRPLPQELPVDDDVIFSPDVLAARENILSFLPENTAIESTQQFLLWYYKVEEKSVEDNGIVFKVYVELASCRDHCYNLLNNVIAALASLETLQNKYTLVSTKTNALHEACEHLLAEQAKLVNSAENISNKLRYFNEFGDLSQKLASPTLSVVNETFVPLLSRLDKCIAYLVLNENFKEASIYLLRFRHLQSTALGMIRQYVMITLQQATRQVLPKQGNLSPSENVFTLFYGKFRSYAPRIRTLMKQIEEKAESNSDYQPLLSDCHQCYFYQREILLGPSVSSAVNDLSVSHQKDHCTLVRSGCAFLLHVCEDEYQLFRQFFSQNTKQLEKFLENLCVRLYDVLRPIIIHINHLETLAELCSILKVEMLGEHMQFTSHELQAFESVVSEMLEDVQERLVYRTHIYMNTDILKYNPASGDLAYPEKLEMMENIAESIASGTLSRSRSQLSVSSMTSVSTSKDSEEKSHSDKDQSQLFPDESDDIDSLEHSKIQRAKLSYSPADLHGMWYPTVRRTIVCLSKLYRCLDRTIFQGLSQEVLTACIQSLVFAGAAIAKRKTELDGQLFQIKHLLILREQISPFQIDFAIKEKALDFSNVKVAAYSLFQKKSKMLSFSSSNAILEFLLEGAPHIIEHLIDSKKAIDKQLKIVCEEFISHATSILLKQMIEFLDRIKVLDQLQADGKMKQIFLSSQPFATADKVSELVTDYLRHMKNQLPVIRRSMSLYLANSDTEYILFRPVKVRVQTCFEQLLQLVRVNYTEEEQAIIACPSIEQISLYLSAETIFVSPHFDSMHEEKVSQN